MNYSNDVKGVLQSAVIYSGINCFCYVTPETILGEMAKNIKFQEAFELCDGSVKKNLLQI